jgi:hypothetical protein
MAASAMTRNRAGTMMAESVVKAMALAIWAKRSSMASRLRQLCLKKKALTRCGLAFCSDSKSGQRARNSAAKDLFICRPRITSASG